LRRESYNSSSTRFSPTICTKYRRNTSQPATICCIERHLTVRCGRSRTTCTGSAEQAAARHGHEATRGRRSCHIPCQRRDCAGRPPERGRPTGQPRYHASIWPRSAYQGRSWCVNRPKPSPSASVSLDRSDGGSGKMAVFARSRCRRLRRGQRKAVAAPRRAATAATPTSRSGKGLADGDGFGKVRLHSQKRIPRFRLSKPTKTSELTAIQQSSFFWFLL